MRERQNESLMQRAARFRGAATHARAQGDYVRALELHARASELLWMSQALETRRPTMAEAQCNTQSYPRTMTGTTTKAPTAAAAAPSSIGSVGMTDHADGASHARIQDNLATGLLAASARPQPSPSVFQQTQHQASPPPASSTTLTRHGDNNHARLTNAKLAIGAPERQVVQETVRKMLLEHEAAVMDLRERLRTQLLGVKLPPELEEPVWHPGDVAANQTAAIAAATRTPEPRQPGQRPEDLTPRKQSHPILPPSAMILPPPVLPPTIVPASPDDGDDDIEEHMFKDLMSRMDNIFKRFPTPMQIAATVAKAIGQEPQEVRPAMAQKFSGTVLPAESFMLVDHRRSPGVRVDARGVDARAAAVPGPGVSAAPASAASPSSITPSSILSAVAAAVIPSAAAQSTTPTLTSNNFLPGKSAPSTNNPSNNVTQELIKELDSLRQRSAELAAENEQLRSVAARAQRMTESVQQMKADVFKEMHTYHQQNLMQKSVMIAAQHMHPSMPASMLRSNAFVSSSQMLPPPQRGHNSLASTSATTIGASSTASSSSFKAANAAKSSR
ncbi:hypothetical protein CAOG_03408 [Capsaspora owczarzaki ATCC 30864]|uniref:Uncharacterized protein n=1 Tax=Capsaspora owczarzaki (strain ATCC 30864) TaxID=595528 RepID=A0A0D2VPK9_CAPO3|nr:hypothetical protein CAOG_03408 [Capsaspora owczarzaki ATCC 30864]KJE92432.1 hypothetical protein CAOG_003408 [Capsaspora owczarzaki ATCC 30864]|eukprot:XP_004364247.2 hypothetical protein CAOG_03408 [Capsaspora owczarzaki ATCC 30864]